MLTTMRNPETPYVAHRGGAQGDQEESKANNLLRVPKLNESSYFEDKEEITEKHHQARKTFLIYIAIVLFLGLADLFYRDPLYALTLEYVPGW